MGAPSQPNVLQGGFEAIQRTWYRSELHHAARRYFDQGSRLRVQWLDGMEAWDLVS